MLQKTMVTAFIVPEILFVKKQARGDMFFKGAGFKY